MRCEEYRPMKKPLSATEFRHSPWIDERLRIGRSAISGKGLIAVAPVRRGERVVIFGGRTFTSDEVRNGFAKQHSVSGIDRGLYLGLAVDEPDTLDCYLNHSCDPNVWMTDEVTLVARRNIAVHDEVTADYAMWEGDESWTLDSACNCGTQFCRGAITGSDWQIDTLQLAYADHFAPYINAYIRASRRRSRVDGTALSA